MVWEKPIGEKFTISCKYIYPCSSLLDVEKIGAKFFSTFWSVKKKIKWRLQLICELYSASPHPRRIAFNCSSVVESNLYETTLTHNDMYLTL